MQQVLHMGWAILPNVFGHPSIIFEFGCSMDTGVKILHHHDCYNTHL